MSEYDDLRRQLQMVPEPTQEPTKITILETGDLQVPDISQAVAALPPPPKKRYLCRCGREDCTYTIRANMLADEGYPDSSILLYLEQVQ